MIQVDNLDELLLLGEIAAQPDREKPIAIALRVYLDTGTHAVWSKFGFNADNGEALRVVRRLLQMPGLKLQGFHAHIGTFILDPDAYRQSATVLVRLALEAERLGAEPVRYLNAGGGFASRARLHYQYLSPEQATPSFDRYAEAICDTIIRHGRRDVADSRLIRAPGCGELGPRRRPGRVHHAGHPFSRQRPRGRFRKSDYSRHRPGPGQVADLSISRPGRGRLRGERQRPGDEDGILF
jgi:hypothetical protein